MYAFTNRVKPHFGKARCVTPSHPTKVSLTITLEHFDNASVPKTFATGDEVGGYVSMEMPEHTAFDAVSITIEGTATTCVRSPRLSPGGNARDHKKSQAFLIMQEPVDRSELRRIKTKEVGWFYQIPFRFEISPDQRKPTEWQEKLKESVRQAQLKLPPSYEKNSVPSTTRNIALISYSIKAKLLRNEFEDPIEGTPKMIAKTIGETSRAIRIVPVINEEPPLYFGIPGKESIAAAMAYLEGKAWIGSQGKMEMEVAQPKSLCVPVWTGYDTCLKGSVETRAEMNLRFEPIEVNGYPPKLTSITAKLRAATRVSKIAMSDCPYRIGSKVDGTEDGLSVETIPLAGGTVHLVKWHPDVTGRNGDPKRPGQPGGRRCFTTVLPLRLVLPLQKQYLPTFHLPLISHFYVLVLALNFQTRGDGMFPTKESLRLEIPIQVSSELLVNGDSHFSDDADGEGN